MSYGDKVTTREIVAGTLIGIGILIGLALVLFAIFGTGTKIAHENNDKVRELTHYCVEKGFAGFIDSSYDGPGRVGCYEAGDLG